MRENAKCGRTKVRQCCADGVRVVRRGAVFWWLVTVRAIRADRR